MQYRTLGRTGLRVSLRGLGSGGMSRLGQRYDLPPMESERLVPRSLVLRVAGAALRKTFAGK